MTKIHPKKFYDTPQKFFRVKKLILGAFLQGKHSISLLIIRVTLYYIIKNLYTGIYLLIVYKKCYIKKLLDVSVLYSSYAMFPVDHNLWSTLPPPHLSLVMRDVLVIFFFGQDFLQKVSSLLSLSLSLSLSRDLIISICHDINNTTAGQHNNNTTTT